ncbi:glucose-fructose oxidoreductase domain-containing protein 1 [Arctopsyche grandis]|uniref:glucose-fructose oxidoreductase domain-containing protein 1 n=1 Tax=Arctopsyche grandis TaxID=121162 RepID=UPI00406D8CAF
MTRVDMLPGIGVFGTGAVARALVPFLVSRGFAVRALWGRTLAKAEAAARDLTVAFYTDSIDALLLRKDVNLVFVLCAPNLHAQISVKALGIGKHVVCDRPAGLDQAEALKMVRASQYYPALISLINNSLRFLPAFARMRKAILDGYTGNPQQLSVMDVKVQMSSLLGDSYDWHCDDTMGGGTLTLVGSHVVDLVTFLTGQKALRVHGVLKTFTKSTDKVNGIRQITSPDFCTFQMEMDRGLLVTATLNNSMVVPCFHQEILVCGKLGQLVVKGGDLHGRLHNVGSKDDVIYLDVEDLECPMPPSVVPKPYIKGLSKMIGALKEAFLPVTEQMGWVKEAVQLAATFEDGQYVQAVMEAIRKSSTDRKWVDVTLLTEQPDPNPMLSAAVRRTTISLQ